MKKRKSELALFNEAARNRRMTYGKLQMLETCGRIKVVNGQVVDVKEAKK